MLRCMDAIPKVATGRDRSATPRTAVGNDSATTNFVGYLRGFMRARGMTQNSELARYVGIEASVVGRWLSGQQAPSFENLCKVAPRLGTLPQLLIEAGLATAEALLVSQEPPEPLPPEIEKVNALALDNAIPLLQRQQLAQIVGYATAMWEEARNPPREPQLRKRT